MSRAQKYKPRRRYLYALLFDRKRVYIGQTIDIDRRHKEHQRDWCFPFELIELGSIVGTQADAEEYEYAWRYRAGSTGFRILCKSPRSSDVFEINPRRRMSPARHQIAAGLRWPSAHQPGWGWWQWVAVVATVLLLLACLPSFGKPLHKTPDPYVAAGESDTQHPANYHQKRSAHAIP